MKHLSSKMEIHAHMNKGIMNMFQSTNFHLQTCSAWSIMNSYVAMTTYSIYSSVYCLVYTALSSYLHGKQT